MGYFYIDENIINNVPDDKTDDILCPTDDEERIAKLVHAIDRFDCDVRHFSLLPVFLFRLQTIGFDASLGAFFRLFSVNCFLCLYCIIGFGAFRDRLLDQEKKINL